jgi:hypothetical protein
LTIKFLSLGIKKEIKVMKKRLNIQGIIKLGETVERAFFSWLKDQGIWWILADWNLAYIFILDIDTEKIKTYWREVEVE